MSRGDRFRFLLREYAESLVIAIGLALLVRAFVLTAFHIPNSAMVPNLLPGDFILAYRLPFGVQIAGLHMGGRLPARGEVVVFRCPQNSKNYCVKRVMGLPGDRLQIVKQRLYLNGQVAEYLMPARVDGGMRFEEKFPQFSSQILISEEAKQADLPPVIVPPGHIYMLSDSRDEGEDSRNWGPVPVSSLQARVLWIWMSFDWKGQAFQVRTERLFSSVH